VGYTTDFDGDFEITPELKPEHLAYINQFAETRRMKRNAKAAELLPDPIRIAAGLPIGNQGAYFVGGTGFMGQESDHTVIDCNREPDGQPCLWCKWIANEEGDRLLWNGAEKFYGYVQWLEYLIKHFLGPWGYTLNGEVEWQGEEMSDRGVIVIEDNKVHTETYERVRRVRPNRS
jgi:hypothetical protein